MKKKILGMFLLVLTFMMLVACQTKEQGDVVAKVDDRVITLSEFNKRVNMYKPGIELINGPEIWTKELSNGKTYLGFLQETILEKIVVDQVIFNEAESKGITVGDDEVAIKFKELKAQIESTPEIKKFYKDNNISDDFLKQQIKLDLTVMKYEKEFKSTIAVNQEEIVKQYEDNKDRYRIEKVKASHILFMTINPDTFQPLSDEKKNEQKVLAEEILIRVKNGEDFAKLAKEYSQDPASAVNGGDLGEFGRGVMLKEFEDAAFSLEVGEISQLVETEFGYHIIKVGEKIDKIQDLQEVKASIEAYLKNQKYQKKIEDLRSSAKIEKYEDNIKEE